MGDDGTAHLRICDVHEEIVLDKRGVRKSLGNKYAGCYSFFKYTVFIKEVFENQSVGTGENPITVQQNQLFWSGLLVVVG